MSTRVVHVVQNVGWTRLVHMGRGFVHVEGRPVCVFASKEAALDFAREKARANWPKLNPFNTSEQFEDATSFDEPVFRDWLEDLTGLRGPESESDWNDWQTWWNDTESTFTPSQREKIWEQMDRVVLYRVVEVPLED